MTKIFAFLVLFFSLLSLHADDVKPPVRFAMIGLEHDHAKGFIPLTRGRQDAQLVGIVEPDQKLTALYARQFHLNTNLFYPTLDALLAKTNIEAVATFTSTYDHPRVVEMCAPHHLTVMMEKPLAVDMAAARRIANAAKSGGIPIIVNYETTWYAGNHAVYKMVKDGEFGEIRKMVAHDGHRGPVEIGCSPTFLSWLTDPKLNGGGALMDFGCYGADLMTWLMDGQRPTSVFAVTQHIKPDIYPKVEDEATIVITYPKAQGIIQGSWNWPYNRKDLEVYGKTGCVTVPSKNLLRVRHGDTAETETKVSDSSAIEGPADQLAYLAAVARGDIQPSGLASLHVNLVVTEILDAARKSAHTGKRIDLPHDPAF
ncbi:MAG TPA: Gfo/Idh/MocA family oxidoreductase [Verrucomicrobiae bacterium]|jgi:predicted dehydrogenase|nr:Gfo/Idh/MocA family oxidoreductase [Verrucomicrobiae bacterium]